ncbi:MAG: tetratricopeptide repeat protein [Deltaproteobacteria bacterium]|nr:tetratricopeptide repeat protein [Deltaproteobacteria bacterium]
MKPWLLSLPLLLGLASPALGEEVERPETSFSKHLPALQVDRLDAAPATELHGYEEWKNQEYTNIVYIGARALGLEPDFVHETRLGMDMVYRREYGPARKHFDALEERFPNTAISSVINAVIWQAMMLENFDFKYDQQYWASSAQARADIQAALAVPGAEGWEHFLNAGVIGIEAIHLMRQEKYLKALDLAFQSMDEITVAHELAPEFTDLLIADGMYNYWRSVITLSVDILPDFTDERVKGIQQMQVVETQGVFLSPAATLGLAFSWLEEHELKRALESCIRNKRHYPDNVINNLLLGNTYTYMRRFDAAIRAYDDVLRVDQSNQRVRYYKGLAYLRSGQSPLAESELLTYLAYDYMEPYQRSGGYFRLGQVYFRQERYADAEQAWKSAVKIDGNKGARNRLDMLKQKKKAGEISY